MESTPTCARCGTPTINGLCSQCGASNDAPPWATGKMPEKSRLGIIMCVGAAVLALLLIGDAIVFRAFFHTQQEAHRVAWEKSRTYPVHRGPVAPIAALQGTGRIYLVQLGPHVAPYSIENFAQWLRKKYSLDVQVLPAMQFDRSAWDPKRHQYIAQLLLRQIERSQPVLAVDPKPCVIGFTDADMYSIYWRWPHSTFGASDKQAAIISSHGEQDLPWQRKDVAQSVADRDLQTRMRRILLSAIAALYWHLPANGDATSLLYYRFDPNTPAEDIYESDLHPAQTSAGRYEYTPTIFFQYSAKDGIQPMRGPLVRSWWDVADPVTDDSVELFQVDLRRGILNAKHTDFYLPDTIPIQFQRVLIQGGWTKPRGFGISGTDNYDKWLFTRDKMRGGTIMHADASADELTRVPFRFPYWWPIPALDRWVDTYFSGNFLKLSWFGSPSEHFELKRFDGNVESYLPCDDHTVCYQIGERNAAGQSLQFHRDTAQRRLYRLTSPDGSWISFSYGKIGPTIASITDSRGRTVRYGYNPRGQLVSVAYPSGETYYYKSDNQQRLLTFSVAPDAKTPPRLILRNEYQDGRLIKQTLPGGKIYTYNYSSADVWPMHSVRVTTPEGKIYDVNITGWNSTVRESPPGSEP